MIIENLSITNDELGPFYFVYRCIKMLHLFASQGVSLFVYFCPYSTRDKKMFKGLKRERKKRKIEVNI